MNRWVNNGVYKCLILITITLLILPSVVSEESVKASISTTRERYPKLFVTKSLDKTDVYLGESITVTITIQNFGNKTAFNVTFIEKLNNPWVFEVSGITQLAYNQIGENETRKFSYVIVAKSLGSYKLNPAQVDYYDSELNPTKYIAYSNSPDIEINEAPEDFSPQNFNAAIAFLLVLLIGNVLLIKRLVSHKLNRRVNGS